jgi:hypothetical protein
MGRSMKNLEITCNLGLPMQVRSDNGRDDYLAGCVVGMTGSTG